MNPKEFKLKNFEGPIDLLVHLVQQRELRLSDITLQEITSQYLKRLEQAQLETGGEFVVGASSLLLMKSRALLPSPKGLSSEEEEEEDPRFEMLQHVVDYCRFRESAKELMQMEAMQHAIYPRGRMERVEAPEKHHGLTYLSLDDLADLLDDVMERAKERAPGVIEGEEWSVLDAMEWLGSTLKERRIPFKEAFSEDKTRDELIVLFLAVLEMMKLQELVVVEQGQEIYIEEKIR